MSPCDPTARRSSLPPGGRVTRRGRDRSDRLLRVAADLFLDHGYDNVTLDEIVAQTGGSKTNIYRYYGSKQAFFCRVVEYLCDDFLAALSDLDVQTGGLEGALSRLARALIHAMLNPRQVAFYRMVVATSARLPEVGRAWFAHGPVASRVAFTRLLQVQIDLGAIHPDTRIDEVATQLHGALVYDFFTRTVMLGAHPDSVAIDAAVDALVRSARRWLSIEA
ncbi:TetR/AcrR family transcriptional regulator [Bordetella holmesii]|uniref:Transcriptional regulator, TetR family n=2 Tax=Bordetella holmesii TaxID=35814 RepID=A0A158M5E7_9BORD|nr:TetR/AcrR family transcriptional regulator [Bordetella holmesii]AHV94864.1 bacterial regulatory s, tetR family protein [Bordetella holmesii ATCC 51541]AIT24755.1 bacterial regulatory s, tetR family protein [Bordetella holmesii 44057]EWM45321.1 bacterial regulatory s, tetR family protein [Bordetella holmesii 70147]EWM48911.1 bacterial regulatory s, tetR family protein [Bordetella holmesii 41130]EWM49440.1 bacterial regulatory s, tetR family protein [Bordetella holmesii 35009]